MRSIWTNNVIPERVYSEEQYKRWAEAERKSKEYAKKNTQARL